MLERGHDPPARADPVGALPVALMPAQPVPGDRLQIGKRLLTAAWCPARTSAATSGLPRPNTTLTDFGADTVTSSPALRASTRLLANRIAVANRSPPSVAGPVHLVRVQTGRAGEPSGLRRVRGSARGAGSPCPPGRRRRRTSPGRPDPRAARRPGRRAGRPWRGWPRPVAGRATGRGSRPAQHRGDQHPPVGCSPVEQGPQHLLPGRVELPGQAELCSPGAEPDPGAFGGPGVVVRRAPTGPGQVVARRIRPGGQHRHRDHHDDAPLGTPRRDVAGRAVGLTQDAHACGQQRPLTHVLCDKKQAETRGTPKLSRIRFRKPGPLVLAGPSPRQRTFAPLVAGRARTPTETHASGCASSPMQTR